MDNTSRTHFLGEWIRALFWIAILRIILNLFSKALPNLSVTLGVVCTVLYVAVLLRMSGESQRYKIAGIFGICGAVITIVTDLFIGDSVAGAGGVIVGIAGMVVTLISEYQEYMGHADVLQEVIGETELAEKWKKLWTVYMVLLILTMVSLLLALMSVNLGAIMAIVMAIGVVVVSILKMVYLHKTSTLFKNQVEEFCDNTEL